MTEENNIVNQEQQSIRTGRAFLFSAVIWIVYVIIIIAILIVFFKLKIKL